MAAGSTNATSPTSRVPTSSFSSLAAPPPPPVEVPPVGVPRLASPAVSRSAPSLPEVSTRVPSERTISDPPSSISEGSIALGSNALGSPRSSSWSWSISYFSFAAATASVARFDRRASRIFRRSSFSVFARRRSSLRLRRSFRSASSSPPSSNGFAPFPFWSRLCVIAAAPARIASTAATRPADAAASAGSCHPPTPRNACNSAVAALAVSAPLLRVAARSDAVVQNASARPSGEETAAVAHFRDATAADDKETSPSPRFRNPSRVSHRISALAPKLGSALHASTATASARAGPSAPPNRHSMANAKATPARRTARHGSCPASAAASFAAESSV